MSTVARKKGLGKGLSALLGDNQPNFDGATSADLDTAGGRRRELPVAYLQRNPDQPRRVFDADSLKDLADSITEQGLLQPIIVREIAHNSYQIIAGERRWRAAQAAGLHSVPVVIQDFADDKVLEVAIIENIQRENLTPLEEGQAYQRLVDQFTYTQDTIAKRVGKSRSHVANLMRLLALPEAVQLLVDERKLSMGHARALLGVENAEDLAKQIVAQGLSVRQTEALVARVKNPHDGAASAGGRVRASSARKDADTIALEKDLSAATGAKALIDHKTDGSGTLTLQYSDLDQLDALCAALGVCGVE